MQISIAITVPVRPVPGLQWTTCGPIVFRIYALASISKAIIELCSLGTPWAGQLVYHRWVTSRHKLFSMFCEKSRVKFRVSTRTWKWFTFVFGNYEHFERTRCYSLIRYLQLKTGYYVFFFHFSFLQRNLIVAEQPMTVEHFGRRQIIRAFLLDSDGKKESLVLFRQKGECPLHGWNLISSGWSNCLLAPLSVWLLARMKEILRFEALGSVFPNEGRLSTYLSIDLTAHNSLSCCLSKYGCQPVRH